MIQNIRILILFTSTLIAVFFHLSVVRVRVSKELKTTIFQLNIQIQPIQSPTKPTRLAKPNYPTYSNSDTFYRLFLSTLLPPPLFTYLSISIIITATSVTLLLARNAPSLLHSPFTPFLILFIHLHLLLKHNV